MAICEMKKLSLIVCKDDAKALTRELTRLSCVELTRSTPPEGSLAARETRFDAEKVALEREKAEIEAAILFLKRQGAPSGGLFARKAEIGFEELENEEKTASALALARKINELSASLSRLESEKAETAGKMQGLDVWRALDVPLEYAGSAKTVSLAGSFPPNADPERLSEELEKKTGTSALLLEQVHRDQAGIYVLLTCLRSEENAVVRGANALGFVRRDFRGICGTAEENFQKCALALEAADGRKKALTAEVEELFPAAGELETAFDALSTRAAEAEAAQKYLSAGPVLLVEGWIPAENEEKAAAKLAALPCCFEIRTAEEGEDPPVKLKNNKFATPFESVVSLYSLPAYGTYDPTFVMSIFYFIIFGMMLADALYGLLLTLVCFLLVKKTDLGDGVKNICKVLGICGISSMIQGILYGSWFGDMPSVVMKNMFGVEIGNIAPLFDPLKEPMTFLIVSLAAGAVHLLAAMGVKFYLLWREGKKFDAVFDVGSWYLLFAGIGLYFVFAPLGAALAAAGALMIVCTAGREEKNVFMRFIKGLLGLYDIVSYASDLLSYSRIMALGLASAVIASVVNTIATLPGPNVLGFVLMPVIIIAGSLINLVINLLGTFVHTARLQYLEFFGKFYVDGGRPFRPLSPVLRFRKLARDPAPSGKDSGK